MATKAVTKKNTTDVSVTNLPDYMKGHEGKGAEGVDSSILVPPRVKLLQAVSPELTENEELSEGNWYNDLSEQQYGKELEVVPVFIWTSVILFRPLPEGGILTQARDGETWDHPHQSFEVTLKSGKKVTWNTGETVKSSRLADFGSSDPENPSSEPAAVRFINMACISPEHQEAGIFVVSFGRSSFKIGRTLHQKIMNTNAPCYGINVLLSSKRVNGHNGPYLEPRASLNGYIDRDLFEQTSELHKRMKEVYMKVDLRYEAGQASAEQGAEATSDKY